MNTKHLYFRALLIRQNGGTLTLVTRPVPQKESDRVGTFRREANRVSPQRTGILIRKSLVRVQPGLPNYNPAPLNPN